MSENSHPNQEVYAVFSGVLDQVSTSRIFEGITAAVRSQMRTVHLVWHSNGGTVSDGICLHNFFRSLPIELCLYNIGHVCSAAAVAYLGAQKRKTSAYASFMIHRTFASPQTATSDRLQSVAHSLALDDERTEAILRKHINLSDDQWRAHSAHDLWLSAKEAVSCGIATEIGEFQPPAGAQIFNV